MTVRESTAMVVRGMRMKKRLPQREVARMLGISRQQLLSIENGRVSIKLDTIYELAYIFDMTGDELVRRISLLHYGSTD